MNIELHDEFSLTGIALKGEQLKQINKLDYRQAMNLPEYFEKSALISMKETFANISTMTKPQWLALVKDTEAPFVERYAAGQLLALFGDPRINPYEPAMITVPAAEISIGIDEESVDTVVEEYKTYGVERDWIAKEAPAYNVKMASFQLAKYCVTNHEFALFLDETKYPEIPTSWQFGIFPEYESNHPVHTVSVEAAEAYIQWLNEKTGKQYRLPTEEEWEYAAKGSHHSEFPWGDKFEKDCANTVESGIIKSTPVGIFPRGQNEFGHFDMAGNVEEYVSNDYYPYPGAQRINDDLIISQNYRIARGGSYTRFRDLARTTRRHGRYPADIYVMGFRLAHNS